MSNTNDLPAISLDELERLIRILGLLGSAHDGEALNAARLAQKWVAEKRTDWRTLLTPEPEQAVTGVAVAHDDEAEAVAMEAAIEADRAQAYRHGYQAGLAQGAQEAARQIARAQAATAHGATLASQGAQHSHWMGPGGASGGFSTGPGSLGATRAQGPVRPSQAPPGGGTSPGPAGSWQAVCFELLSRHAQVPGVLRSREEIFVSDLLRRGFPTLTPAQEAWLRDIARRNSLSW